MEAPQNPAGEYVSRLKLHPEERAELVKSIADLPGILHGIFQSQSETFWHLKYRNWTTLQILHHMADSHSHALLRFKMTLTELRPTIKPYDETATATLSDYSLPPSVSLKLLEAVHTRWVVLLNSMTEADFNRVYLHPQYIKEFTLTEALGLYAWHGRHHTAQIQWVADYRV